MNIVEASLHLAKDVTIKWPPTMRFELWSLQGLSGAYCLDF